MANTVDLIRLLGTINSSDFQKSQPAAYQTIVGLIKYLQTAQKDINAVTTVVTKLVNAGILTWDDESQVFTLSRELIAGSNVTIDNTVKGESRISALGSVGGVPPIFINESNDGGEGFPIPGPIGPAGTSGGVGIQGNPGVQIFPFDGNDGEDSYLPGPIGPTGPSGSSGIQGNPGISIFVIDGENGEDSLVPGPIGNPGAPGSGSTHAIGITINGGGTIPPTGIQGDIYIPYSCTISAVTLLADQSGSCVIDIWKVAYASFPPTIANTITASALPTISSATNAQDNTLTGWTKSITAGDCLRFNLNSITSITRVTLVLTVS